MQRGAFTFVLHSHLPYCRIAGRWPHGEEWIHEAAVDTYLPLLTSLYQLRDEGVPFRLTIGLTPILTEQLADPLILEHLEEFLEDLIRRARADVLRYGPLGDYRLVYLAQFYQDRFTFLLRSFRERFGRSIVGTFRQLQDEGFIEVTTSAATHGYLPLLARDASIYGQLATGCASYRRHFGRDPRAIWLPECAYRPGYFVTEEGQTVIRPGIEGFVEGMGLGLFFSETHLVEGGAPVGKAAGDALGPYQAISRRYRLPVRAATEPTRKTTYQPYYVYDANVAVMGRNNRTGMQVWSAQWGYPGDYAYREFHKKDGTSGLHYWKVSGAQVDLAFKDYYDPVVAAATMQGHAAHFARLVEDLVAEYHARNDRFGIVMAAYDTELFGHWWFEGVDWIREVLRHLSRSEVVALTTASGFVEQHPPDEALALPEGSWGQGGTHFTWDNVDTQWMWPPIHEAERRMERLVARYPQADGTLAELLNQAARELLLLQSSDWPFLVTTGQAKEYAITRFQEHLDRFHQVATAAESGWTGDDTLAWCRELQYRDNPFPNIDYHWFAPRQGHPVVTPTVG
ncbi:MAG: DUF1957 domain-containing protein [Chloroflexi bacterium]|nr:DUF1957 domain-containing protein [Chloroflexota bacterium]